jgi:hypothetical protein
MGPAAVRRVADGVSYFGICLDNETKFSSGCLQAQDIEKQKVDRKVWIEIGGLLFERYDGEGVLAPAEGCIVVCEKAVEVSRTSMWPSKQERRDGRGGG